jgi:hypothetical protein
MFVSLRLGHCNSQRGLIEATPMLVAGTLFNALLAASLILYKHTAHWAAE